MTSDSGSEFAIATLFPLVNPRFSPVQNGGNPGLLLQVLHSAVGASVIGYDNLVISKIGLCPNAVETRLRIIDAVPGEDNDGNGSNQSAFGSPVASSQWLAGVLASSRVARLVTPSVLGQTRTPPLANRFDAAVCHHTRRLTNHINANAARARTVGGLGGREPNTAASAFTAS